MSTAAPVETARDTVEWMQVDMVLGEEERMEVDVEEQVEEMEVDMEDNIEEMEVDEEDDIEAMEVDEKDEEEPMVLG
ncbi:ring-infected erythrocyte surface antigen-like [Passer domesticus]|uniref:ring-infected erythrocyte surface antigen-like n=1 Tax=Passer domesticus TaxID=48849 RepID=UPI0030FEEF4D